MTDSWVDHRDSLSLSPFLPSVIFSRACPHREGRGRCACLGESQGKLEGREEGMNVMFPTSWRRRR